MVFLVPFGIQEALIQYSKQKISFMRLVGVFNLQVGDAYVLQDKEPETFTFEGAFLNSVQVGNYEAVGFLLDHIHVDVNLRSSQEVTEKLISNSIVSYKLEVGSTAVLIATRNEDKSMVELLLDNGADFTIKTKSGVTPYAYTEKGSRIRKIFDSDNGTERAKTETIYSFSSSLSDEKRGLSEVTLIPNILECSEMEENRDPEMEELSKPFSQTEFTSPIECTDNSVKGTVICLHSEMEEYRYLKIEKLSKPFSQTDFIYLTKGRIICLHPEIEELSKLYNQMEWIYPPIECTDSSGKGIVVCGHSLPLVGDDGVEFIFSISTSESWLYEAK